MCLMRTVPDLRTGPIDDACVDRKIADTDRPGLSARDINARDSGERNGRACEQPCAISRPWVCRNACSASVFTPSATTNPAADIALRQLTIVDTRVPALRQACRALVTTSYELILSLWNHFELFCLATAIVGPPFRGPQWTSCLTQSDDDNEKNYRTRSGRTQALSKTAGIVRRCGQPGILRRWRRGWYAWR